ncbi:Hypothetical protein A7982_04942 [Minicystis rosea]|nr:Hypothetical protein A7982_04942 [Minicystis rosea]
MPIHDRLLASGGSLAWNEPFYGWVLHNDVKSFGDARALEGYVTAGVGFLIMITSILATGGTAGLVLGLAGAGMAFGQERVAEGRYQSMATLRQAQVTTDTGLVYEGQVDAAMAEHTMAKINVAIELLGIAGQGVSVLASEIGAATRASARARAAETSTAMVVAGKGGSPGAGAPAIVVENLGEHGFRFSRPGSPEFVMVDETGWYRMAPAGTGTRVVASGPLSSVPEEVAMAGVLGGRTPVRALPPSPTTILEAEYVTKVANAKGIHPDEVINFYAGEMARGIDHRLLVDSALVKYPKLTRAEAETIYGYTTKLWYRDFNRMLEAGTSMEAKDLAKLLKSGIDKMPRGAKTQYRGIRLSSAQEVADFDAKFALNAEVTTDSFWSTGPDPSNAYSAPRSLIIRTESARNISDLAFGVHFHGVIGKQPYTSEAIIPPGVKLRVIRVDAATGTVVLKEIP